MSNLNKLKPNQLMAYLFIVIYCMIILVPTFWLLMTSLKNNSEIFVDPMAFPKAVLLSNYMKAWDSGIKDYFLNSMLVTVGTTCLTVSIATGVSYALAKLNFKINKIVYIFIIVLYAVPPQGLLVPLYNLMTTLHLSNSSWGLIFPYTAGGIPFATIILYSFFIDFPHEVEDSAKIDGANNFQILFRIVIPLSRPAIMTACIIQVIATWNEFFLASLLLSDKSQFTLPLGLSTFKGEHMSEWGPMMASVFISVIPLLILYLLTQKYIVNGLGGMGK